MPLMLHSQAKVNDTSEKESWVGPKAGLFYLFCFCFMIPSEHLQLQKVWERNDACWYLCPEC